MKLTENEIVVYCISPEKLINRFNKIIPHLLKENQSFVTPADGIIMVKIGYLLINNDCLYQPSETELRTTIGLGHFIRERFRIGISVNTKVGSSVTHGVFKFSHMMDCDALMSRYCEPASKTLKEYMGSRYNYNPRVIKNMTGVIGIINDLENE